MPTDPDIPALVDRVLSDAMARQASDVHIEPGEQEAFIRFRVDGLLVEAMRAPIATGRAIVNRLMVMAQLLTYRVDVPQEGRAAVQAGPRQIDLRISIMPTLHGLRAAVRLPAELSQPRTLGALGLDDRAAALVDAYLAADSGALLVVGPAGSGKTTTAYAILEALRDRAAGLSIVTLEDPIERSLPGITQIPVTPFGQMTYATALRSMLRQDPQVLMLGEIRDAETASIAVQAALSGHRLICTFHATDPATAVARLLEMRIEPYQIASSLFGVLSMRLLRRGSAETGYVGRRPVSEALRLTDPIRQAIGRGSDTQSLRALYTQDPDHRSLAGSADELVRAGLTDLAEVRRVLGEPTGAQP